MPPQVHGFLGGLPYPVEEAICDLSCRAQGTDNILSSGGNLKKECLSRCKQNPVRSISIWFTHLTSLQTVREQELQMSMDCSDKCSSAEPCLKSCIQEQYAPLSPGLKMEELTEL